MTSDARAWRTSSYSGGEGGNCVQTANGHDAVMVRDSKLGDRSPVMTFEAKAWRTFIGTVKAS
jgi:hypothetical protein